MVALNIVEADHQWVAAHRGIDAMDVDRWSSICALTICGEGLHVIEDLPRAALDLPSLQLAVDLGVRAYAGVPVRLSDGHAIGALCVLSAEPTAFDDGVGVALMELADHLALRIELAGRLATAG